MDGFSNDGSGGPYHGRLKGIYDWMEQEQAALVMFEDFEGRRDPSLRWLSGHPADALLFLSSLDRSSLLVPWDINMAGLYAQADRVIPYGELDRRPAEAIRRALELFNIPLGARVEVSSRTPYPVFPHYGKALPGFEVICRSNGVREAAELLRARKDPEELRLLRKAAELTNEVIDQLERRVREGTLKTELDAALFIEAEGRKRGAEGTGFETLAAGPSRSFAIHAFPPYTAGPFAAEGMSILDFGLKYGGYTTDVTLTFVRGALSARQEKMLALTERAYTLALSLVEEGVATRSLAAAVDALFAESSFSMPHALGHGIGLEAHEAPGIRNSSDNTWQLKTGMVFTLEPGLYGDGCGGCRLENDILLTEKGPEPLTNARIIRL